MFCSTRLWLAASALLWASAVPAAKTVNEEFPVPLQSPSATARPASPDPGRTRPIRDELGQGPAIRAATAPAAITAAVAQAVPGCRMIRFNAGFGWVATGTAQYPASDNQVALRRTRQDARFQAFTDAYARLAGCLVALSPQARQHITATLEQNDAIRLALINLAFTDADKNEQALRILARGFVTHSIREDQKRRAFYVNLVATPNTATRLTRPTPNAIEAISLQDGLRQVQAEVEAGLIPPTGNRLIVVNATGELALVGYAINLIGIHPDPAAQDKLRTDAEKIATNRATEALIGLALGDDSAWQNGLDEASRADLQTLNAGYANDEPSVSRFLQIRDLSMTALKEDLGLIALREGRLPAVAIKRFRTEDAVTVAMIYTPTIKKRQTRPTPAARTHLPTGVRSPSMDKPPAIRGSTPAVPPPTPAAISTPAAAETAPTAPSFKPPISATLAVTPTVEPSPKPMNTLTEQAPSGGKEPNTAR
ncbi:MAG: hypothetical protein WAU60_03825 [Candidatus Competibacter denitrificans]|jgi:hypothetical protein